MDNNEQPNNPDAAILSELDGIAAGDAPAPDATFPEQQQQQAMDWRMAAAGVVLIVDRIVAPNWQLDNAEKDALSEGIGQVLSAFFPNTNLDPRVQALLALGGVALAITAKRTDLSTGKVTPLRLPKEPPRDEADEQRQAA